MQLTGIESGEPPETDEQAVLERCREGDSQAFGWLVRQYMKRAYFTALGLVGNHEDALDLSQEAFVRAYRALGRFDVRQQFFTWYYKILRNLCLNHLRDRGARNRVSHDVNPVDSAELAATVADGQADPAVLAERNDLTEKLWQAIALLKPDEREVLMLRELDGCSYAEIAVRLEIPAGTVMSRLFNARQRLKEKLEKLV